MNDGAARHDGGKGVVTIGLAAPAVASGLGCGPSNGRSGGRMCGYLVAMAFAFVART